MIRFLKSVYWRLFPPKAPPLSELSPLARQYRDGVIAAFDDAGRCAQLAAEAGPLLGSASGWVRLDPEWVRLLLDRGAKVDFKVLFRGEGEV